MRGGARDVIRLLLFGSLISALIFTTLTPRNKIEHPSAASAIAGNQRSASQDVPVQSASVAVRPEGHELHELTGGELPQHLRVLKRMQYWENDIASESHSDTTSNDNGYLTLDYDVGGWNNVRMSLEMGVRQPVSIRRPLGPVPSPLHSLPMPLAHASCQPRVRRIDIALRRSSSHT